MQKKTVKDMADYCNLNSLTLLSDYDATFWTEYKANYTRFDNIFKKLFKTFEYFDQLVEDSTAAVTAEFRTSVYNWLLMNHKRYDEIWRINVIDDTTYSITDNYSLTEEYIGNGSNANSVINGQRTDVNNSQIGSQNVYNQNNVTAFNTNTENTNNSATNATGTRNDIEQYTKGQEEHTARGTNTDSHNLKRYGNIGTMSSDDIMRKHDDFWKAYNFYMFVFEEISQQFFRLGKEDESFYD